MRSFTGMILFAAATIVFGLMAYNILGGVILSTTRLIAGVLSLSPGMSYGDAVFGIVWGWSLGASFAVFTIFSAALTIAAIWDHIR